MERINISIGNTIKLKNSTGAKNYVIDRVVGRGAHCIAYEAHSTDAVSRKVRIKECYPAGLGITRNGKDDLLWPDESTKRLSLDLFEEAYEKQITIQNDERFVNTFIHVVDDVCKANNTLYTVVGIDNGITFAEDDTEDIQSILKTVRTLANVIAQYHNNGYLYLDIKPENFLVLPETRDLIKIFDSDTIVKKEDLLSGNVSVIPYTPGWAAPEQIMGKKSKVSEKTDIYAIGAVLFSKIMDRCPDNDDIGVYTDYIIPEYWTEKYDSRIIPAIKRIFRNTITASIKRRFEKVEELIAALDDAIKICSNEEYILPKESISDIYFVGRNDELEKIDNLFKGNTKVVFIHGFGGIGKTELAKRYVQKYKDQYDVTVFGFYNQEKGLDQFVQDITIKTNDNKESSLDNDQKWKKIEKLCTNKSLFVVDNFDVDDDKDLGKLLSWNAKFIFTSRNDHSDSNSEEQSQLELNAMETDELIKLFVHEFGREISEEEDLFARKIIEEFDNYTMMVPLIAKQLRASDMSLKDFWEKIDNEGISGFGDDTETIKHRKDGKITQATLLGHMNHLFNLLGLDDEYKCVLANVKSLEEHRKLTKSVYREYTQEKNLSMLNDLIDRGLIEKVYKRDYETDGDILTLALHPIVSQLIEETLDDEKYYKAIIKNTHDKFVELNANPEVEDIADNIGNVLRSYCDACKLDGNINFIYEELFKFISYKYRKGILNVNYYFSIAHDFSTNASFEFFYGNMVNYLFGKIFQEDDYEADWDVQYIFLASCLYNFYFKFDIGNETMVHLFRIVNICINKLNNILENYIDNNDEKKLQEINEIVKGTEDFIVALQSCMRVSPSCNDCWIIYPNYSFDGEFNLTKYPDISEMYFCVAKVAYSLSQIFKLWKEEKKAQEYLKLYNNIISIFLYYQGVFVIPEMYEADIPEIYINMWEENKTEENEDLKSEIETKTINLLYCSNRTIWRKRLVESFERMILNEQVPMNYYARFVSRDFLFNQPAVIRKSLLRNAVFDNIYSNENFSYEDKKFLLSDFVCHEIENAYKSFRSRKKLEKKIDIINIYYGCLEKMSDSVFKLAGTKLTEDRINFYIAISRMIKCNKRKNQALVDSIGKEIVSKNIQFMPQILELTKYVYNIGFHKVANANYRKILNLWEDRESIRNKSQTTWINYLWTLRLVSIRQRNLEVYKEVYSELNLLTFSEWIKAIKDAKVYIHFKHEMIQECYRNILTEIANLLVQDGYEAITNTAKGKNLIDNGKKLRKTLEKSNLRDSIKNTQISHFFNAICNNIDERMCCKSQDDLKYFIYTYNKQDRYDSKGKYIAEKWILLATLIFGKDKARDIMDNQEPKMNEKIRKNILDKIETYPDEIDYFTEIRDEMPF